MKEDAPHGQPEDHAAVMADVEDAAPPSLPLDALDHREHDDEEFSGDDVVGKARG